VRIVQDVCSGLHTAHELCGDDGVSLQLVHRDVSPQNIMVTETGAAKLVDFGVAKAIGRSAAETDAGTLRGKLAYLAPEQLAGTLVDRRVDLFAVGVILYELTTGVHPFRGNSAGATMKNILRRRVPPPSEVTTEPFPDALDDLILRALDREQEFRFQTAADINKALDGVFAGANRATAEDVAAYVRPIIGPSGEQFRRALKQASRRAADSRRDVASIPAQSAQPVEGTPSSGRLMVRSSAPQARHSTGTPAGLPLGREASSVPAAPGTQRDDSAVSVSSDAAIGARGQGTGPSLVEADVAPPVPGDTTAETDSRVVVGGLSRRMAIVLAVAMALLVVAVGALALARFGGQ
jgi:serine/threonine protein kinase